MRHLFACIILFFTLSMPAVWCTWLMVVLKMIQLSCFLRISI
jgi:hypothetical protein